MIALHQRGNDYARFLPAVNDSYAKWVTRKLGSLPPGRLPSGIEPPDLDFLNKHSKLWNYDGALYTGAFGVFDRAPTMFSVRERPATKVLGDSGGFSLISGSIGMAMPSFRAAVLKWQEQFCDVGIILDIPTRSLNVPASGYTRFDDCMNDTIDNIKFALSNRSSSALRLLNVAQGRNHAEARIWIKNVLPYKFEGLAIAGHTRLDFWFWIKEFRRMIDQKDFDHITYIHFLGTGEPGVAVILTALKRALRKHLGRDIEISFDSSRAFHIAQANKQVSTGLALSQANKVAAADSFSLRSCYLPRNGGEVDLTAPFPFSSPLRDICLVGHFMPRSDPYQPAFDTAGLQMLSNHEAYVELTSIYQANRLVDMQQRYQDLVPWHIKKCVEAFDGYLTGTISDSWLNRLKPSLQYYAKGYDLDGADR